MSKLTTILCAMLFVYCCFAQHSPLSAQSTGCCTSKYSSASLDTLHIKKLASEYARLKRAACEACNSSMSDYRSIMESLGEQLNGKTKEQIARIMGQPDYRKKGKYIYFWRGWHDYLYFTFTSGRGQSQWYYALE